MTTRNQAIEQGYSQEITADADTGLSLNLLVKPDADLGDYFRAYCLDAGDWIRVAGWLFTCETIFDHLQADSLSMLDHEPDPVFVMINHL